MAFGHRHPDRALCALLERHAQLSPIKVNKLQEIIEREDLKWRHDRVKEYLIQRIKVSYNENFIAMSFQYKKCKWMPTTTLYVNVIIKLIHV